MMMLTDNRYKDIDDEEMLLDLHDHYADQIRIALGSVVRLRFIYPKYKLLDAGKALAFETLHKTMYAMIQIVERISDINMDKH